MQGNILKPSRTIVTSFNPRKTPVHNPQSQHAHATTANEQNNGSTTTSGLYEEGDWVLCLTSSDNTIACALSSGEVQVYDKARLHVQRTLSPQSLAGSSRMINQKHQAGTITDLVYAPNQQESILACTDTAGRLTVMDLRQRGACSSTQLSAAALSVSLGYEQGQLAAIGSIRGRIHFTDLRKPTTLLGTYLDSHTTDVTQVTFDTTRAHGNPTVLLSAADDGLLCLYDTTQPTEELARQAVCNVGTAVRHAGFCGGNNNNEMLYCLTGSETMSLWRADTATAVCDYGWDTRRRLSQAAGGGSLNIDFLVDAYWNESTQQLNVMAGTSAGEAVLYSWDGGHEQSSLRAEYVLHGGHRGVVRAWTPLQPGFSTIMTAGEDARLCEWRPTPTFSASASPKTTANITTTNNNNNNKRTVATGTRGGPMRRQRSKTSTSPY